MGISPHENTPGSDFECHDSILLALLVKRFTR